MIKQFNTIYLTALGCALGQDLLGGGLLGGGGDPLGGGGDTSGGDGVHSANTDKIDLLVSTKAIGVLKWQYFFDSFMQNKSISEPGAYDNLIHVCWFSWEVEQWTDQQDRWALTLSQNCPELLIEEFIFQLDFGEQAGTLLVYDASRTSTTFVDGVANIRLTSGARFGIWLTQKYDDGVAVQNDYIYDYIIRRPGDPQPPMFEDPQEQENQDSSTCQFVHDRLKLNLIDSRQFVGTGDLFTDPYFDEDEMTVWENARFALGDLTDTLAQTTYLRTSQAGWTTLHGWSLWGENGIELIDMKQGQIGNVYIISGAATIAEVPARIEKVFDNENLNEEGFYQLSMYKLGSPIKIQIDDRLPMTTGAKLLYAQKGDDKSLWGPILEKAFAKFYGNYEVLIKGRAGTAMSDMTGAPFIRETDLSSKSDADLWQMVKDYDDADFMMNAESVQGPNGSDQDLTANNIANAHAYTVLAAFEVSGTKLFKMRNPWAIEKYSGPWADKSSEWESITSLVKEQVGYSDADDGIFFIPMNIFKSDFSVLDVVAELSEQNSDRFLMLDDLRTQSALYGPTVFPNNVRHNFTLYSAVTQTVYMTIYVHHARSYPTNDACNIQWPTGLKRHAMQIEGVSSIVRIADGQQSISFAMNAGETKNLHAEFAWHLSGITKDFGLVAYGRTGEVTLTHADGLRSASWPKANFAGTQSSSGGDSSQSIPGSSIAPFELEAPFTASDLYSITSEFISETGTSHCFAMKSNSWEPFSHKGDNRSAILFFHRCPGRLLTAAVLVKSAEIDDLIFINDEAFPAWKDSCVQSEQYEEYLSCSTTISFNTPFVALYDNVSGNNPGLGILGSTKVWADEE